MISYKEYLKEQQEEAYYQELVQVIESLEQDPLNESIFSNISKTVKDQIEFVKKISAYLKIEFMDILKLFKNKILVKFMNKIKWSTKQIVKIVKDGYKLYTKLNKIIAEFIAEQEIVKFTKSEVQKLDDFLQQHPLVKRTAGLVVAGFLIYQWTSLISFTGDIDFDFDQSTLFATLMGSYTLSDIFLSPSGIQMLTYIATGVLTGISFPWPGPSWVLFLASIVYTLSKDKYPEVSLSIVRNVKKFKNIRL